MKMINIHFTLEELKEVIMNLDQCHLNFDDPGYAAYEKMQSALVSYYYKGNPDCDLIHSKVPKRLNSGEIIWQCKEGCDG